MNRYAKNIAIVVIVLLVAFAFKGNMKPSKPQVEWSYNKFVSEVEKNHVNSGELSKTQFTGDVKQTGEKFYVPLLETDDKADIRALLVKNHVIFKNKNQGFADSIGAMALSFILPVALLIFFWFMIMRQAQMGGNQAMAFGRSRAKRLTENVPKVTFEDVAGVDEAKQELEEVVEFLRNPKKFQELGAKIPKGVLLLGPPGCGKTLLARAIAGEAGVPFFHISGSDFVEMFVGVGASRVRDLFDTAKANRPSLIFIDEIDAVGRQRGAGLGGGHDEREQTLNQLLVEMDGFDPNAGVILIAATNRPDVLDPALLRPGRFDRRIVVDNPDAVGRKAILGIHTRGKPLSQDVNLGSLARRTPGFSGADLANLVNEAALLAARRGKKTIEMIEMEDSIDRVVAGPERKSRIISDKEKEMVAYHEVGHAIVLEVLPLADPVHKVSVLPRGMALGYTMQLPMQDKYLTTKSELMEDVAGLLGGRVSEQLVFNEVTTGANSDLDRATDIARAMVCEFGMSETLGPLTLGRRHGNPFLGRDIMEDRNYSEEIAMSIDKEVRKIIDHAYERAKEILSENRDKMDKIVQVLLEKETLERDEFEVLMYGAVRTPSERGESETTLSPGEGEPCAEPAPPARPERNPRLEPGVA